MKYNVFVFISIFCFIACVSTNLKTDNVNEIFYSPYEIERFNTLPETEKQININMSIQDPLEMSRMKSEIMGLFLGYKNKDNTSKNNQFQNPNIQKPNFRFTQTSNKFSGSSDVKVFPNQTGQAGVALKKEYHADESIIEIDNLEASSTYADANDIANHLNSFSVNHIKTPGNKMWCSTGNHGFYDIVDVIVTLPKSTRLEALWIYWVYFNHNILGFCPSSMEIII